ncbi:Nn.00g102140.m01.CDS01 [Neocucurbitaria sp. VM-36]
MARRSAGFVSKKAHRKSRGGCLTCKKKKVKCDENQPTCSYCSTRSLNCEYPLSPSSASTSPSSSSPLSHDNSPSDTPLPNEEVDFNNTSMQISTWLIPPAFASSGQLTFQDHELLHHYRRSTWKTFAVREDTIVHTLHRDFIPQSSLSHSYLIYALLSIAASHSNSLCPSKQVEKQALVYRQKTFQEYSKALQNITTENYETILVTGTFLLALIPLPTPGDTDDEHLEWLYSLLKMSEGLRVLASLRWAQGIEKLSVYPLICRELRTLPPPPILHTVEDSKLCTPVGPLGTTPDHPNPAPTYQRQYPLSNPIFLPPRLMALFETLVNPPTTGPLDLHRNALVPVFHALSPIFLSLYYYHLNQDFYVRIFVFTSFLMPEFLALVKAREPRALTLIAWWFALAGLVPKGWWVGSCVGRVIEGIGRVVRMSGDVQTIEACEGAEKIVEMFERVGSEKAARSIFEGWEGIDWDDGPRRAEEWEFGQLLDLDDVASLDISDLSMSV